MESEYYVLLKWFCYFNNISILWQLMNEIFTRLLHFHNLKLILLCYRSSSRQLVWQCCQMMSGRLPCKSLHLRAHKMPLEDISDTTLLALLNWLQGWSLLKRYLWPINTLYTILYTDCSSSALVRMVMQLHTVMNLSAVCI